MEEAVMNEKVRLIPCCTISKLRKDEIFSETEKRKHRLFEDLIQKVYVFVSQFQRIFHPCEVYK